MSNTYASCRIKCAKEKRKVACFKKCVNKPVQDLVEQYFPGKGGDCSDFDQKLREALYPPSSEHIKRSKTLADQWHEQNYDTARKYYRMAVAPYPPNPSVSPMGVSAKPDYESLRKFIETNPCYRMSLIARAKEALGEMPEKEVLKSTSGLDWRFWVGAACLSYAAYHFVGRAT